MHNPYTLGTPPWDMLPGNEVIGGNGLEQAVMIGTVEPKLSKWCAPYLVFSRLPNREPLSCLLWLTLQRMLLLLSAEALPAVAVLPIGSQTGIVTETEPCEEPGYYCSVWVCVCACTHACVCMYPRTQGTV